MGSRFLLVSALLVAGMARGQGCSQCRDNVAQTPPGVQASYRDAIGVMMGGVSVVLGAGFWVFRRLR